MVYPSHIEPISRTFKWALLWAFLFCLSLEMWPPHMDSWLLGQMAKRLYYSGFTTETESAGYQKKKIWEVYYADLFLQLLAKKSHNLLS